VNGPGIELLEAELISVFGETIGERHGVGSAEQIGRVAGF
jgi:hypothetical protein